MEWVVVDGDTETDFTASSEVKGNITVTAKWTENEEPEEEPEQEPAGE